MPALAEESSVRSDENCADRRVRFDKPDTLLRELDRSTHDVFVRVEMSRDSHGGHR